MGRRQGQNHKTKSWFKNEDGVTAIEFSLLALPFIMTITATIELALFMMAGAILEGATSDAARTIKTGQLQQSELATPPIELFKEKLCEHGGAFLKCDDIQFHVKKLTAFDDDLSIQIDEEGAIMPAQLFEIDQIGPGCVALVRVVYSYKFKTPFFASAFSNYPDNRRLHMSTSVFRTEPYAFKASDPDCVV